MEKKKQTVNCSKSRCCVGETGLLQVVRFYEEVGFPVGFKGWWERVGGGGVFNSRVCGMCGVNLGDSDMRNR